MLSCLIKSEAKLIPVCQLAQHRSSIAKYTAVAVAGVSAGTWRPQSSPAGGRRVHESSHESLLDGLAPSAVEQNDAVAR